MYISYLKNSNRVVINQLSTRTIELNKNPWYKGLERIALPIEYLKNEFSDLYKENKSRYFQIRDRVYSLLEYEDYIARKYKKYILVKYDFISYNGEVEFCNDFIEILERMKNNKRMNSGIRDLIIGHCWCIDETVSGNVHMHLFLYLDASWVSGNYFTDNVVFKDKIDYLNVWIYKLVRNCKSNVSKSIINLMDINDINIVDYYTSEFDNDSRNDNKNWLYYLTKQVDFFITNCTGMTKYYGRSKIEHLE